MHYDVIKIKAGAKAQKEEIKMINWNNVPSSAVDVVFAQEERKLANQMERDTVKTARETLAWVDSFGGKYDSPEEERYVTLMKKSAEMRLAERGITV